MKRDAKQEAEELFNSMYNVNKDGVYNMTQFQAKQCAIICCKKIIEVLPFEFSVGKFETTTYENKMLEYYKEVLAELQKL